MGFETRVLQEIQPLIQPQGRAEFAHGTLFVHGINPITAQAVRELLSIEFAAEVLMTQFRTPPSASPHQTFAFDFVAELA